MNPKYQELAFDVVLPAHLLVNPRLEPNAKLFYGLVRNLTKVEGYCYAGNEHLADLMEVDERTIRRWLEHLENEGYIERCMEDKRFNPQRHIFISDNFKKVLQPDKNVHPPGQSCPPPRTKMSSPIYKEDILKEDKEESVCQPIPVGDGLPQKIIKINYKNEEISITQQQIFKKSIESKKNWTTLEIQEAWKILFECEEIVNDCFAFIEGTIKNLRLRQNLGKARSKSETKKEKHQCHTEHLPEARPVDQDSVNRLFQKAGLPIPNCKKQ